MDARKLTAADVCNVTGYNRDQLRGLLQELPQWSAAPAERRARAYLASDLVVLGVVHVLDVLIGMRRKAIAAVFPQLRQCLSRPRSVASSAWLVITFNPVRIHYVDGKAAFSEGVVVFLQPIIERVDSYLGVVKTDTTPMPATLLLRPTIVATRRRRGSP
jgi:hypothetical protein